jgi:hypothetical protein
MRMMTMTTMMMMTIKVNKSNLRETLLIYNKDKLKLKVKLKIINKIWNLTNIIK